MRVFLDANVLFSAAKSDGAVRELLRQLLAAGHECWVDAYVVAEARRNLEAKDANALSAFESILRFFRSERAEIADPTPALVAWLPEKDRPVLAAAIRFRCDALITGDRTHFGAGYGKTFAGVTIHSPRSMGEMLRV